VVASERLPFKGKGRITKIKEKNLVFLHKKRQFVLIYNLRVTGMMQ
jgi:hypothetical protein